MTPEDFDALFDTFANTAVRLEGLPWYDVADYEGKRLAAWLDDEPLPVRSTVTDPWLARIATTSAAGKKWMRVRVIDDPPTDYQLFELAVYPETQAVGEEIFVASRRAVGEVGPDFWLFDIGTPHTRAVVLRYGPRGEWLGADLVDDPQQLTTMTARVAHVLNRAQPLNTYLAEVARG